MKLSVVICTYNPVKHVMDKVLGNLQKQTMSKNEWELVIIDNNSSVAVEGNFDLSWHPNSKILREEKAGLLHARIKGVNISQSPLILFVDDDNLLDNEFLKFASGFSEKYPEVGCFGGKSLPVFETDPPSWFFKTGVDLGCQDFGNEIYISQFKKSNYKLSGYPAKAPIGTGMVISKKAFLEYYNDVKNNSARMALGRKGNDLTSGEDNDIVLTVVKKGFEIAYVPQLVVSHWIPVRRFSEKYLQKIAYESSRSWVKLLSFHGICPWKKIQGWTYGFRAMKSYFTHRAWQSPLFFIKWRSSCGMFKGLAEI